MKMDRAGKATQVACVAVLSLLLGCLAVEPERRSFCDPHWLAITLLLLAVSWLVALDHAQCRIPDY